MNSINHKLNVLIELYQNKKYEDAEKLALTISKETPDNPLSWQVLGAILIKKKRFNEAVTPIQKSIELFPEDANSHSNLGVTLYELGKINEAEASLRQSIKLKQDNHEFHNNLGNVLKELGKLKEAEISIRQAIKLKHDYPEAYNNLGNIFKDLGKLNDSEASYKEAIRLRQNYPEAYNNLGIVQEELGKLEESEASIRQAINLRKDYSEAYCSLGITLQELCRSDEAEAALRQSIKLKQDYADAYYNLSFVMNQKGKLQEGFKLYEWRSYIKKPIVRPPRKTFILNTQDTLQDKKLLVYEEQGLGDIIHFYRYLPLLEKKGASVIFKVKKNMHHILSSSNSKIQLTDKLPENNQIDFEIPLMSVPNIFNTKIETIPTSVPYLKADNDKIIMWNKKLPSKKFKIGICWQGSKFRIDKRRSFPLSFFEEISRIPNVELVNLYKGKDENKILDINFNLTTLGEKFDSSKDAFIDTAAVMMLCDLIITSDTVIAHLAGALGRPVWVALKYIPDWRWLLNRSDSPWYPTMRLYRQEKFNNWNNVFRDIEKDLEPIVKKVFA